jgi:hypothetical protein
MNERWTMNRNYERTMNDRMIEQTNDRNFGSITAGKDYLDERWIGTMNERWTVNRNYERDERSNDQTNEWSEFQQHNGWTKIIWTNEWTNDRTNGRTNHEWSDERSNDQTNEWMNKLRTDERTIEERPNDPCASVCLCGKWSGRVGGRERVAMKWLRVAWEEPLAPLFIAMMGGLGGGMRGLVGGWED